MELFNIGTAELLVILLIGLLLFGPEDLVKIARTISGHLRTAQRLWQEVASQLEVELLPPDAVAPPERPQPRAEPADVATLESENVAPDGSLEA